MRISDWSSDGCSSDLNSSDTGGWQQARRDRVAELLAQESDEWCPDQYSNPDSVEDRKSVVKGKSVSVRVDNGGRRFIKKKNTRHISNMSMNYNKITLMNKKTKTNIKHKKQQ